MSLVPNSRVYQLIFSCSAQSPTTIFINISKAKYVFKQNTFKNYIRLSCCLHNYYPAFKIPNNGNQRAGSGFKNPCCSSRGPSRFNSQHPKAPHNHI